MSYHPPLTDTIKARIRELRSQKLPLAVIASRLGLSKEAARRIVNGNKAAGDFYRQRMMAALGHVPTIPDEIAAKLAARGILRNLSDEQETAASQAIAAATEAIQAGWTPLEHERHGNRHYRVSVTKVKRIGGERRNDTHARE